MTSVRRSDASPSSEGPSSVRLRWLFIAPTSPWPADDGGRLRLLHLSTGLLERGHEVTYLGFAESAAQLGVSRVPGSNLDVHSVVTMRSRSRSLVRSVALGDPLYVQRYAVRPMARAVEDRLETGEFDVVLCAYSYLAGFLDVRRNGPLPLRVLDAHNLEFKLAAGRVTNARFRWLSSVYARRERRLRKMAERRAWSGADLVLATSEDDRREIKRLSPGANVVTVPNGVDPTAYRAPHASDAQRRLVFVGKLDYWPNLEGLDWFLRRVWPRVLHEVPDASLDIVGKMPGREIRALVAACPGVSLHPDVPDVRPFLERADVSIVPLLSGSGTRLKALEAMAAGLPLVSTTLGVEGLALPREVLEPADDEEAFATEACRLLQDRQIRQRRSDAGRRVVEQDHDWRASVDSLDSVVCMMVRGVVR